MRLRYNGLQTTLGADLTNNATAITFGASLTHAAGAVPTIVAGDHIPLSILGASGLPVEIVYLSAYTTGTTTGTIIRGREKTTGVAHLSAAVVASSPTVLDYPDSTLALPTSLVTAKSDEFDGLGGPSWTDTPLGAAYTPPNYNSSLFKGAQYLRGQNGETGFAGRTMTVPATYPYTITTRIAASNGRTNGAGAASLSAGIILTNGNVNTSDVIYFGLDGSNSNSMKVSLLKDKMQGGSRTERDSQGCSQSSGIWLRVVMPSADLYAGSFAWSPDGVHWLGGPNGAAVGTLSSYPDFVPTRMGLAACNNGNPVGSSDALVDFFRVTQ